MIAELDGNTALGVRPRRLDQLSDRCLQIIGEIVTRKGKDKAALAKWESLLPED